MRDQVLDELEDPDTWDWERQEKSHPDPDGSSTIAIALTDEEFDLVEATARREGVTVSAFSRKAVLDASKMSYAVSWGQDRAQKPRRLTFGHLLAGTSASGAS